LIIGFIFIIISGAIIWKKNNSSNFFSFQNNQNGLPHEKPGTCKILAQVNCDKAEISTWQIEGQEIEVIGLKLPKGATVFSAFNGQVTTGEYSKDSPFKGFFVALMNTSKPFQTTVIYIGDLNFDDVSSKDKTVGDTIASIGGENHTNLNNYNLIIMATKPASDSKSITPDSSFYRELFVNL